MYYIKILTVCTTLWLTYMSSLNASVIPAAIIRRHTVTYRDVPVNKQQPIKHQTIYVPASMVNLFVRFLTTSSKLHIKQQHIGAKGQTQATKSEDPAHILKHEIKKPVIQEVREVIVPYRQVIQEIKPVIEEVKTVVATGQPKSTVYMNFGDKSNENIKTNNYENSDNSVKYDEYYGYVVNTNHGSNTPNEYITDNTNTNPQTYSDNKESDYRSVRVPEDNLKNLRIYDLSSIYGIKPTNDEIINYNQNSVNDNKPNVYDINPVVYGLTQPIAQNSKYTVNSESSGYSQNSANSGYSANSENSLNSDYSVSNGEKQQEQYRDLDTNANYGSTSGTVNDNPNNGYDYTVTTTADNQNPVFKENAYYLPGYALNNNNYYDYTPNSQQQYYANNLNSDAYYANSGYNYDNSATYVTQNVVNTGGYSDGYSGDLAMSDGSATLTPHLQSSTPVLPIIGQYSTPVISKTATLGSLAPLLSTIPYQYAIEQAQAYHTYKGA